MKVIGIKKVGTGKVYDITVDQHENYILENGLITHNSGLKYAASTIAMLSKKKDKDSNNDVVGNIIKVKMHKSRLSKENGLVEVRLSYDKGLDRYYGLLELAEKHNIIKKVSTRYEMPNGAKLFGKEINTNPEKYFTDDILKQLDECAKQEYSYGMSSETDGEVNDDREDDTI